MKETIEAIYENGVFRPLGSPHVADGQRVWLEIEATVRADVQGLLDMAAKVYAGLSEADIDEIERCALDRSDFFHGRDS